MSDLTQEPVSSIASRPPKPEDVILRPTGDTLLIWREPKGLTTLRGIVRLDSDSLSASIRTGIVLAVGPGAYTKKGKRMPVGIEVGERVVFHVWHVELRAGLAIRKALARHVSDDVDLCLVKPKDVLMVITGEHELELP